MQRHQGFQSLVYLGVERPVSKKGSHERWAGMQAETRGSLGVPLKEGTVQSAFSESVIDGQGCVLQNHSNLYSVANSSRILYTQKHEDAHKHTQPAVECWYYCDPETISPTVKQWAQ